MALTIVSLVLVAPRGGSAGVAVAVDGENFGAAIGRVRFDPLGEDIDASVTVWGPAHIEFVVPALLADNQFVTVLIERGDLSDGVDFPFWYQATGSAPPTLLPPGLDFQWPNLEEGEGQDIDDPRTSTAADFNRMLDRIVTIDDKLSNANDAKDSCQAATTADLGGTYNPVGGPSARGQLTVMPDTVDAVGLIAGARVLVKDQTDPTQNGIYEVTTIGTGADGVWDRAPDFDSDGEVSNGAFTVVTGGLTNALTLWVVTSPDPHVAGGIVASSNITWGQVSGGGGAPVSGTNDVVRAYVGTLVAGDTVYTRADGLVARASASSETTSVTFLGLVQAVDLPVPGQATIRYMGDLTAFGGLITGKVYVLSTTPGGIVAVDDVLNPAYPNQTPGSGHVLREVGHAAATTVMFIEVSKDFEVS